MKYPHVTAIVNTYKRASMLQRALESVLRQTFTDYEVIVVHDGPSDDATKAVFEEFAAKFPKHNDYNCIELEENSGYQCVPKNVACWHANGDYIAYLDDDNEWTDDHLAVLVADIEHGQDWPDFVYGRREYIDTRSPNAQKETPLPIGVSPFVPFTREAVECMGQSPKNNFIDTSDVLISKGSMWRVQLATDMMWNEKYRRFGDWELFARGINFAGWKGRGVDKVVQKYYWHGENLQLTRPYNATPKQQKASTL